MNNAIYVVNLGTDDAPRCRMGVCALADVPKDAVFVVVSPDAENIIRRVKVMEAHRTRSETADSVDCETFLCIVADNIRLTCEGGITASPYEHEIVKDIAKPTDADYEKSQKFYDAKKKSLNKWARELVLSIHDAIAEAAKQGVELESVFFGGKFAEMREKPKFVYKIECHGDEDAFVGGEMTFTLSKSKSVLRISEQCIDLSNDCVGYGSHLSLTEAEEFYGKEEQLPLMIDALAAFFARCHEKRM